MSKTLQIGTDVFEYPDNNQNPGWGEEASNWAEAVTNALADVQSPNDIPITSISLLNQTPVDETAPVNTWSNITGLFFNTALVNYCEIHYEIRRIYNGGATVKSESGSILGNFDGNTFAISREIVGDDLNIFIDVTSAGQFKYVTHAVTAPVSCIMKFYAKTIAF